MSDERWEPVPVPLGDGRHDIGDDMRAAIVKRLIEDWSRDRDLTPEKVRQLAMWAGASVRALFHELGTLRDLAGSPAIPIPLESKLDSTGRDELASLRARLLTLEQALRELLDKFPNERQLDRMTSEGLKLTVGWGVPIADVRRWRAASRGREPRHRNPGIVVGEFEEP